MHLPRLRQAAIIAAIGAASIVAGSLILYVILSGPLRVPPKLGDFSIVVPEIEVVALYVTSIVGFGCWSVSNYLILPMVVELKEESYPRFWKFPRSFRFFTFHFILLIALTVASIYGLPYLTQQFPPRTMPGASVYDWTSAVFFAVIFFAYITLFVGMVSTAGVYAML